MGVAVYDDVRVVTRRKAIRRRRPDLVTMTNVDARALEHDVNGGRQSVFHGIRIAEHGAHGCDRFERTDNRWPTDVARVQDDLYALQSSQCLGSHQAMGIRNQSDEHDVVRVARSTGVRGSTGIRPG